MNTQLQRYFVGLIGFGFVVAWSAAGVVTAILALLACAALVAGPQLLQRQRRAVRPRPVRARPLREEAEGLPLVPDDPSLILEFG
ncbi:MAG TPA: hypothetical protein VIE38_11120 [Gaiellaceae bacterium]